MKSFVRLTILVLTSVAISSVVWGGGLADLKAFTQGQKSKYDSLGHPKAKGIRVTVEYPSSWQAEEGQRPNVVQKFIGKDDSGNSVQAMLLIMDVPFLGRLTKDEMLKEESLRNLVKEMGGTFQKSGTTKIESEPAAWVIFTQDIERVGMTVRTKNLMYLLMYKGKWIQLGCAIGGLLNDPTTEARFNEYLPVFQLIGNSVILPDKWK
jgi:hypothetical protein